MAKNTDKDDLPDLKKIKINRLYTHVINEIVDDSKNYMGNTTEEKVFAKLKVVGHELECGAVGSLMYSSSVKQFFRRYKREINELLADKMFHCGAECVVGVFNDKWEKDDPLALEWQNQNLLARFAYEEVAFRFGAYLENSLSRYSRDICSRLR
jgi:hypothetical protein